MILHASPSPGARHAPPIAVLGPTNTGKTHYAIERMLAHESGMIGLPLRLLAREVYDRVVATKGARVPALVTGEEKIVPATARYWICTAEAMPLDREVAFLAIDEIQLAGDLERGRVFTSRLLHARGVHETLFLGSETMRPLLRTLFPDIRFLARDRLSKLAYAGPRKVTRLPRRSAVVGFSADTVYAIAELIRRQRGGAAVILGALSPRTRNAQAALYQSGEVDYLVATDAIGMGLNMDIDHVAFSARRKFDGHGWRDLRDDELAQIAGRAGRHMRDGTFGVTADCPPFEEETVAAIEEHQFTPLTALQWRSEKLDFASLHALTHSLAAPTPRREFQRARTADDEAALHHLSRDEEIRALARGGAALALLWDVCQIPDFRKVALDQHARLLGEVYLQLARDGRVSSDWLGARVLKHERADGDIDAISARIAHVRTWTYLANRAGWIEDGAYWQEKTRSIEDSLSDALHEKLTQRFVDRRTSVLLQKLKDDAPLLAGVNEDGDVIVEGQFIGRLLGFEFIVDPRARGADVKRVRNAAERVLAPELAARAAALANATTEELSLQDDGTIWWRAAPVATLRKGPAPLRPDLVLRGLDSLSPHLRGRIQERLQDYFANRVEALLADLLKLGAAAGAADEGGLNGLARGVAYRLVENFGAMSRTQFGDELKQLDQEQRGKLRQLGVRFGEFTLFMPALLKPAPARLLTLLWAIWTGRESLQFQPPKAGLVSMTMQDLPHAFYYACGYRPSGARAVRIDMLERLANQIRAARQETGPLKGGFVAGQAMMSLVGCSGEEFETILVSLGYRKQTVKAPQAATEAAAPAADAPPPSSDASDDAAPSVDAPEDLADAAPEGAPVEDEVAAQDIAPPTPEPLAVGAAAAPAPDATPVPAANVEIVFWRLAPRRPSGEGRGQNRNRRRPEGAPETRRAPDRRESQDRPRRNEERKPQRADVARDRSEGRRDDRPRRDERPRRDDRARNQHPPRNPQMSQPQHRKVADPNSPFAVLASLKDELAKQQPAPPTEAS